MRVRILSGHQTGSIVDVGPEGAIMISNGFAELALEMPTPVAPLETAAAAADDVAIASLADEDEPVPEEPQADRVPGRLRTPRKTQTADPTSRRKRR